MTHFIKYCKHCQTVLGQCRCHSENKTIKYGVCTDCKKAWEPKTQPWVVCAAIKRRTDGLVLAGARHFDRTMTAVIRNNSPTGDLDRSWGGADQGFIDQWGRFYSREEAAHLAKQNEQCANHIDILYSEDLY